MASHSLSSLNNSHDFGRFYEPAYLDVYPSNGNASFVEVNKAHDEIPDQIAAVLERDSALQPVPETHSTILFLIRKMLILSDGVNRTDPNRVIEEINENKEDDQDLDFAARGNFPERDFSIGLTALTRSREWKQFEVDTHFNGQVVDNTPIHIRRTARNFFSRFAKLFLGQDIFNRIRNVVEQRLPLLAKLFWGPKTGTEDLQTLAQQQAELNEHRRLWDSIKGNLNIGPDFPNKMRLVFESANKLLKQKKKDEQLAYAYRIAFYATLTFSVIGKIVGQRAISILGFGGFVVTFFLMNQHYDQSVREYKQKGVTLKKDTGAASVDYHYSLQQKQQQQFVEQQIKLAAQQGQSL